VNRSKSHRTGKQSLNAWEGRTAEDSLETQVRHLSSCSGSRYATDRSKVRSSAANTQLVDTYSTSIALKPSSRSRSMAKPTRVQRRGATMTNAPTFLVSRESGYCDSPINLSCASERRC